jgi:hypothetical protein
MPDSWPRVTQALVVAIALGCAGCALTRSEVKALRDRDAPRIAFDTPIPTTIADLNALPSHCGPAANRRRSEEELRVYQVVGTIRRVRRERDRDVHIVLADLEHPRDRLVIELGDPDTRSGRRSPFLDRLVAAQRTFGALQKQIGVESPRDLEGRVVRVTGVGFYDVYHFQRGRSRSCIELHPVLSIEPAAN